MKKVLLIIILLVLLHFVYFNLPFTYRYSFEINVGNKYINNIEAYFDSVGSLPESNDWSVLNPLMPEEMEK